MHRTGETMAEGTEWEGGEEALGDTAEHRQCLGTACLLDSHFFVK